MVNFSCVLFLALIRHVYSKLMVSLFQIGGPPGGNGPQVTMTGLRAGSSSGLASGLAQYEHLMSQQYRHHQQQPQVRVHQPPMSTLGGQPSRDVKRYTNQATDDRYGLKGLLGVIRMTDPDLTTLAIGTDLTTLGLNLNSRENLYKTFASPWAEGPTRGEPEYTLPACYVQQAPRLQVCSLYAFGGLDRGALLLMMVVMLAFPFYIVVERQTHRTSIAWPFCEHVNCMSAVAAGLVISSDGLVIF